MITNPVGINATNRTSHGVWYKSQRASAFIQRALTELRHAGFVPQPEGMYWCSCTIILYTSRLDIDGPLKTILDCIMWSLSVTDPDPKKKKYRGVEDRWNGQLLVIKVWESKKSLQRAEIEYTFTPIKDKREFNEFASTLGATI